MMHNEQVDRHFVFYRDRLLIVDFTVVKKNKIKHLLFTNNFLISIC